VETGILSHESVAQDRDEISRPMTGSKEGRRESCSFRDLLLAATGIKEGAAKLRRIKASSIIAARQACRQDTFPGCRAMGAILNPRRCWSSCSPNPATRQRHRSGRSSRTRNAI
jgi:hypothetical protein